MTLSLRNAVRTVFRTRLGKLLPVILIAAMVSTASAAVYATQYSTASGTVKAPDVTLTAGSDSSPSCSAYPCATVTPGPNGQTASIAFSLFPTSGTTTPVPATYYADLVHIVNTGAAHSVKQIVVYAITNQVDLGNITIYLCTSAITFSYAGVIVNSGCASVLVQASTTLPAAASPVPVVLAASGTDYLAFVANAANHVTPGTTIALSIAIQWT